MNISVKAPTTDPLLPLAGSIRKHMPRADAASLQKILAAPPAPITPLPQMVAPTLPVKYPHSPDHSAGGSSGDSAGLIAAGEVGMALGGDQGGSIRTPSCWCGVYGLKPTWGLVPVTGAMPIAYALDHCGPMGASTADVARLLTAIAGPDPHDPRTALARTGDCLVALEEGVKGLTIGVLKEGFGHPPSDPATDRKVRAAI